MIKIFKCIKEWREFRADILPSKTLGFVPTMGNLHDGHINLVAQSVSENDLTLMSIFVNPTQFNHTNDLENYPRTLERDLEMAESAGVNYLLLPDEAQIYPDHYQYKVSESAISQILEGKHRPGHFDGVLTVVLKLLQLAKANTAYFGEKDFQQLQLIKGMVNAFFLDTKIIGCPTFRNKNNLALSSRNSRLSCEQLELAEYFANCLHSGESCQQVIENLQQAGIDVEYVEECDGRRFAAVRIGDVRLIDNIELKRERIIC